MRLALTLVSAAAIGFAAEPGFDELASLFDYDRDHAAGVIEAPLEKRGDVAISEFSFASPVGGRVPGLLVEPIRDGSFPIVLYGHWMMKDSPLRNKREFLEEAAVLAKAGAICLLLDGPLVREGAVADHEPMNGQGPRAQVQMATEWRRALDLLLDRENADSARVAYVGHSFSAGVGAMLSGVEKRIGSFVLMANQYSLREFIFDEKNPAMIAERAKRGDDWAEAYLEKFPFADTVHFARRSAPSAVFLQFGRDDAIPDRIARLSLSHFSGPKRMEFYDTGHALNATARVDRAVWLAERLKLEQIDRKALESIAPLR